MKTHHQLITITMLIAVMLITVLIIHMAVMRNIRNVNNKHPANNAIDINKPPV